MNRAEKWIEFRDLNPERHGNDQTTKCFVCGGPIAGSSVYCENHLQKVDSFYKVSTFPWGTEEWLQALIVHPDFNGISPYANPCANCDKPLRGNDYLCDTCRAS